MKKSLLALAVLASIAGAASAQSSVTIYGLVDAGIARETGGAAGSVTKVATGVQSGNRLGFKGTEDLGSGLKANFQIESGYNLDDGTGRQGALFGRQAWVGLSGNFGAVALGRQYDPIFVSLDSIDPFGTGLEGATTNLMSGGNVRTNNAVTYSTPTTGGFSATVLYGAGEQAGNSTAGRTVGLSGTYENGPIAITAAYDKINQVLTTNGSQKLFLVGGTYNFGVAKLHVGYETDKSDRIGTATTTTARAKSARDVLLGVSVPVGAGTILGSFIKETDKTSNNAGAKQYAVGYLYSLSKRTNLYTSYARISNDNGSAAFVGDASSGGSAVVAGHNSTGFSLGLRHKF